MASRSPSRSGSGPNGTYMALLRGINVGGKNILPMRDLAEIFSKAGCSDVRTYIQSGNVVFAATAECAARISSAATEQIQRRFGIRSPVIVRTAKDLRAIAADNPFLSGRANAPDVASLHVAFLAEAPVRQRIAALDPARSPGDRLEVHKPGGREIYMFLGNGVAKSRFTNAWLDSTLATTSTLRNWRTVLKLLELSGQT
ncbi:MAG TPA: DUF1697 domain-containing protein [Phycisphaerales bacterium]|nr:DUF1697 domain-containing protein [Phycisphaerales bacterium]